MLVDYLFKSTRLGFRILNKNDAKFLLKNHNESSFKQWFPNECYTDVDEALEAINFFSDCAGNKILPYVLAIELLRTNELIGDVGVNEIEGQSDKVEIGFSICEKYQGFGYATETLTAMSEFIVENFFINSLYGRVINGNDISCKVLQKCGFKYKDIELEANDDPYGNGMLVYLRTF